MRDKVFSKKEFIASVTENVKTMYRKTLKEATQQEIYQAVSLAVKDVVMDEWMATQQVIEKDDPKILYYMSMEFLMGRALGNNLINLGAYGEVKEALEEIGLDLSVIEDQEPDPALGNGGLGRLAACFMDSLATLGYAAYGCGIRYRYGMFKQQIIDGFQIEVPDNWLKDGYPFELRRPEYCYEIKFGGHVEETAGEDGNLHFEQVGYQSVLAIPYDMPIVGYGNHVVDSLMIWDAQPKEEFSLDSFDRGDYDQAVEQENLARNLVEVLYPNDNHVKGKELRLKQQYFFVSASIQRALERFKKHHNDLHDLPKKVTFQMNDTHPTVAVAELMRILLDEEGMSWDEAWEITTHCVAYTNHTIMAEALEKWPIDIFQRLLPRVYQIVEEINRRFVLQIQEQYPGNNEKIAKDDWNLVAKRYLENETVVRVLNEIDTKKYVDLISKKEKFHIQDIIKILNEDEQFCKNVETVKEKFHIAEQLDNVHEEKAVKDIYRSQIVFLESALDYYMHCLGIYAMVQMYNNHWDKTRGYSDLKVPIDKVMDAVMHPENTGWIDAVIVSYHASKTYMSAKEIKGQLSLIVGKDFFDKIANEMFYDKESRVKPADKLARALTDLFERRNKIAHQADRNHQTGDLYDINRQDVENAIGVVETFVTTVHKLLTE